ncbi:MAG: hypothetical protein JXB25_06440 [Deltaproteobacteria bacterium]|nr:hypothetical protein [Deltaproteobacteria bacterium]
MSATAADTAKKESAPAAAGAKYSTGVSSAPTNHEKGPRPGPAFLPEVFYREAEMGIHREATAVLKNTLETSPGEKLTRQNLFSSYGNLQENQTLFLLSFRAVGFSGCFLCRQKRTSPENLPIQTLHSVSGDQATYGGGTAAAEKGKNPDCRGKLKNSCYFLS